MRFPAILLQIRVVAFVLFFYAHFLAFLGFSQALRSTYAVLVDVAGNADVGRGVLRMFRKS